MPAPAFPAPRPRALLAGLALLLCVLSLHPAAAQDLPPLTGRVVDGADLLDPAAEAALSAKLAAFEARSSDQVVVATVPDLQGYAIEEFGVALGRAWKIGREGENNGVILLVSSGDRKVRIEVGYGLEGTLTDAAARTIIETDIVPRFRSGDYAGGIAKGVDDILSVLSGDASELQARAERNAGWQSEDLGVAAMVGLFVLIWLVLMGVGMLSMLARIFGRKVGRNSWRWLGRTWTSTPARRGGFVIGGGSSGGGGFSGGGGSFGGGGSSGSW